MNTNSIQLQQASQQYVNFGNNADFNISGDMTVEVWVKPSNADATQALVSKDFDGQGGSANRDWRLWINGSGFVNFDQWNSSQTDSNLGSGNTIPSNTWTHIAWTFNHSTQLESLYINGVLNNTHTAPFSSRNTSNAYVQMNTRGYTSKLDFGDGLYDELRIWNIVRSATDISNNYQRELAGNESGLVAYYKFNNNYNDSGPNGLNGSASGTPSFSTDVPFADNTTTSTSTTTTTTSTSTTTTSTSTSSTTSTSTTTSTTTTSTSTTTTSTTTTVTTTSTTTTSTSTTTTTTSTTTTSTSTTTTTSTSTSTTITLGLLFTVEKG